jgi:uncharacterized OB-fold protein
MGTCKICGQALAGRRKTYCSDPCYQIGNQARAQQINEEIKAKRRERRRRNSLAQRSDPAKLTPRTCLKCGQDFPSSGPGHRICSGCTGKNREWLSTHDRSYIFFAALLPDAPAEAGHESP